VDLLIPKSALLPRCRGAYRNAQRYCGVIAAETELIASLPNNGLAIVNGDHEGLLEAVHRQARCRIATCGERVANQFRIQ
jgi:hypothetical protein